MGKKSRNKKQKSSKETGANRPDTSFASSTTVPQSLSGGVKPISSLEVQTEYIRTDIVRICLLLVAVILIFTASALFNHKTTYLHKAGARVTTFLRLQ